MFWGLELASGLLEWLGFVPTFTGCLQFGHNEEFFNQGTIHYLLNKCPHGSIISWSPF